jgi:hypothetical protein
MVLLTLGYLGLIAIGWKIDRWLGAAVFVLLTAGGVVWLLRGRSSDRGARPDAERRRDEVRVLVVAEDGGGSELVEVLRRRAAGRRAVVQVISPASAEWLASSLVAMRSAGLDATGETIEGAASPAVEEAVRRFRPDELVVSAGPAQPAWLDPGFVGWARERFDLPVVGVAPHEDGAA